MIEVMRAKNYDLVVVTSKLDGQINGQAVAWNTQASIEPPMMAVGLSIETYTHSLIKESGIFAINFIPKDRQDLIEFFGYQSGRDVDKFKDIEYTSATTGSPILKDAAAFLDCRLVDTYALNDHDFYVGEVVEADYRSLDWFQSKDFIAEAA